MGYYTEYELEVIVGDNNHTEDLRQTSSGAFAALSPNGDSYQECKWYDHEDDMKEFSTLHPEALFKLSGKGEENDDIWVKYFQNGLMQVCRATIAFEPFDSLKLK